MGFELRMMAREMRASWRRLIFFFLCLALGVAAIVGLRSVIQSIQIALSREARSLTAADIRIQTNRPWTDETRAKIEARLASMPDSESIESVETTTMVRPAENAGGATTMVELRAVEPGFPFYGSLVLDSGRTYSHEIIEDHGALVRPELLTLLDLEVGDSILIGGVAFTVRDVIVREPGRSLSMFSLGPRVLIDFADLDETGLIRFGSRVRYQLLVRVGDSEAIDPLMSWLEEDLKEEFVRVRSFRETGDRVSRRLSRAEDYLSLAGFVIMILGGIGVWSVVRVFVHQKLKSIAVLKCLGATSRRILHVYVLQVVFLGLAGSVLGVGLARLGLAAVPAGLAGDLETVAYGLTGSAVIQGVGIGVLVSLLFSVVPLLEIRRVKPQRLLRPGDTAGASPAPSTFARLATVLRRLDREQVLAATIVLTALVILAIWQAGSSRVALHVCGGFVAVAILLHLTASGLVRAIQPLGDKAWFPLRHAVLSLSRPGNQTRVILLAVGLGSFFLLAIYTLEAGLVGRIDVELQDDAPDLFVIDVQQDQAEDLETRAWRLGATHVNLVPVLRARVIGVDGNNVRLDGYDEVRERGWLGREYVITYRSHLESNERILAGRFWDPTPSEDLEVSIEENLNEDFGIGVGDRIRFDVLGRELSARVTSIRDVEWSDSRNGGFMFVFRPGVLEMAPHTYVGFIKGPTDTDARAAFQRDLVIDFQNLSILDLQQVLRDLRAIVDKVSLAVSIVGGIALLTGALILIGSLTMTKFQRRYETAIFRTVGAKRRAITTMMLLEYGTLGVLAGFIGALGALGFTWVMSTRVLEIPWTPQLARSVLGIVLTAVGVSVVGVVATFDVINHKPLSILRAE